MNSPTNPSTRVHPSNILADIDGTSADLSDMSLDFGNMSLDDQAPIVND
jgi:hypothetical protein